MKEINERSINSTSKWFRPYKNPGKNGNHVPDFVPLPDEKMLQPKFFLLWPKIATVGEILWSPASQPNDDDDPTINNKYP